MRICTTPTTLMKRWLAQPSTTKLCRLKMMSKRNN
jgi:hypothetical protein